MRRSTQRGNILFLILLAVVLFAALAYAVTSSMRGGGKDSSSESAQTGAAAITQYVTLLRNEVQRLMMVNDCKIQNLDWRDNYWRRYDGAYAYVGNTSAAPASFKSGCAIFQAFGGAIAPLDFEKYKDPNYETYALANVITTPRAGHAFIRWVNRKNENTSQNDVAIMWRGIRPDVCRYLLNSETRPAVSTTEDFKYEFNANDPSPAPYTTNGNIIDEDVNITGDFFANTVATTSCQLGAIILPL